MSEADAQRDQVLKDALQYRVQLTAYARSLLGNLAAAEDVVQEAMLVVVRKYEQFRPGTSMLAWCRSIVRLEVLRLKEQRQKERTLADRLLDDAIDSAFSEYQTERREAEAEPWREALERCLGSLPDRGHRVLRARFVDELSYQQIGQRVGMKLEAVRKTLFRLKKQVRACVEARLRGAP